MAHCHTLTLGPLQCMHSVHCSVYPVYTLADTGIGSGYTYPLPSILEYFIFNENIATMVTNERVYISVIEIHIYV